MAVNDGGSAFPIVFSAYSERTVDPTWRIETSAGMTLRDYFAAQALSAAVHLIATNDVDVHDDGSELVTEQAAETLATNCYRLADAMLKARADV